MEGGQLAEHLLGFRGFFLPLWSYEFVGAYFFIFFFLEHQNAFMRQRATFIHLSEFGYFYYASIQW